LGKILPGATQNHERLTSEGDSMTTPTPDQRHLAALFDGEPGPGGFEVAIDAVERDEQLRGRFERGYIIGQVLRGERFQPSARAISSRVSAALASEPVIMRPRAGRSTRRAMPINRSAAGLAIAASLVAVAILVGPGLMTGDGQVSGLGPDSVTQTGSDESLDGALPPDPVVERWVMEEPAGSTSLDALLVDHRERASASGLTGFIPYAAVVGPSGVR
jgi:hypothetical protein